MDEEIDRLVVSVRADTRAFARDVATMRAELDGPFADGLERAGSALERGLTSAIQRGKFGFDDLRRVAFIRAAQQLGLGLQAVKAQLAQLPEQRTPTVADWRRISRAGEAPLDARIAELHGARLHLANRPGGGLAVSLLGLRPTGG